MRVAIVGTSGSGKSTLARRLGVRLGAPTMELDALNWGPRWFDRSKADPDAFARRVSAAVTGEHWVTDGNYSGVLPIILRRATDVVWLDYGRGVVMRRVILRSLLRSASGRELWPGTGNREDWRRWLDQDHPIRWAWSTHKGRRARYETMLALPRFTHLTVHRLRRPRQADGLVENSPARRKLHPRSRSSEHERGRLSIHACDHRGVRRRRRRRLPDRLAVHGRAVPRRLQRSSGDLATRNPGRGGSRAIIISSVLGFVITGAVIGLCVIAGVHSVAMGLAVGVLAWLAGPPVVIVINGLFIKIDPKITLAHCLGYGARIILAGLAAGIALGPLSGH